MLRDASTIPTTEWGSVGWARDLAFRSDGSTLTFAIQGAPDGLWELHDVSLASGRDVTLFPAANGHHTYPSWSLDGRLAYFSNGADGVYEASDGAFLLQGNSPGRVAWTATGSLTVTMVTATGPGDLYLADPVTRTFTAVVTASGGELYDQPSLSPDGTKLAYIRRGAGPAGTYEEQLWTATADGRDQRRLTTGADDSEPAWSSDGGSVLFNRFGDGIFLYELGPERITRVTSVAADSIAWNP